MTKKINDFVKYKRKCKIRKKNNAQQKNAHKVFQEFKKLEDIV